MFGLYSQTHLPPGTHPCFFDHCQYMFYEGFFHASLFSPVCLKTLYVMDNPRRRIATTTPQGEHFQIIESVLSTYGCDRNMEDQRYGLTPYFMCWGWDLSKIVSGRPIFDYYPSYFTQSGYLEDRHFYWMCPMTKPKTEYGSYYDYYDRNYGHYDPKHYKTLPEIKLIKH
jgi:hypothetical protein